MERWVEGSGSPPTGGSTYWSVKPPRINENFSLGVRVNAFDLGHKVPSGTTRRDRNLQNEFTDLPPQC